LPGRWLRFGEFEFDPLLGELRRLGKVVALTPQAIGLLSYLIDHRDRVVARDELLDQVWGGDVVVSYGALNTAVYELRTALGDDGQRQLVISTHRRRGFRFIAAVDEHAPAPPPPRGTGAPAAIVDAPFVGRQRPLERLAGALADAIGGHGRAVIFEGEAGIGKTTLAQRFAARAAGARVLWGRCYEHAGAPPFWPWIQILREPIADSSPTELRRLFGGRATVLLGVGLESRLGDVLSRPRGRASAAEVRFQVFDGVAGLLRAAAEREPLILVIDDIHNADHPSLLLLEFLVAELARARLLLVATYRGEEIGAGHPLAATLSALARQPHCERHLLRGLEPAEVGTLLGSLSGHVPSAAMVESIARRTEGNPLFIKELALQTGEGDAAGDALASGPGLTQPMQEIMRRRIERLSPATQDALCVAAVLGRDVRVDVLTRTWDGPRPLAPGWIDEAVRAQIIAGGGSARAAIRFAHALFQEAFYGRLDGTRRSALHRRAGEALEAVLIAPSAADLAALAHHFREALPGGGDPAKAVTASLAAARAAGAMLAYEEAVQQYTWALRALEWQGVPHPLAYADVLLALGEAHDQAGTAAAARQAFVDAAQLARRCGAAAVCARAALGYAATRDLIGFEGDAQATAINRRAAALLAEALEGLDEREPALLARVQAALAVSGTFPDREREQLSRSAMITAERLGEPALLAEIVAARRELLWAPDNVERRLELANTMVALAQQTDDRELEMRGRTWRLTDLLEHGDMRRIHDEIESCAQLAVEIGQLKYRHLVAMLQTSLAILAGRFDEAEQLALDALALGRRMRSEAAEAIYVAHLMQIRQEQGTLAEIETMLRALLARSPVYVMRSALVHSLAEIGRLDEVRAQFERLADRNFADLPRDRYFLCTLCLLGDVAVHLGDRVRGATLYEMLLPFAELNVVGGEGLTAFGAAAFHLGRLAALLERWDEAERLFQYAAALNSRLGALAYVGQLQRVYAEMLLARRAPGDRARALDLLARAIEAADRYGAHGLRRHALAARKRALAVDPAARHHDQRDHPQR
jgi:DNA-binding winged helix-turn-helix (wHTH) protein